MKLDSSGLESRRGKARRGARSRDAGSGRRGGGEQGQRADRQEGRGASSGGRAELKRTEYPNRPSRARRQTGCSRPAATARGGQPARATSPAPPPPPPGTAGRRDHATRTSSAENAMQNVCDTAHDYTYISQISSQHELGESSTEVSTLIEDQD